MYAMEMYTRTSFNTWINVKRDEGRKNTSLSLWVLNFLDLKVVRKTNDFLKD